MSILKSKKILVFCDHVFSHASEKLWEQIHAQFLVVSN